jgi:uncharacterized protein DUF4292
LNRAVWILFLAVAWLGCPKRLETGQVGASLDARELLDLTSKVESQVFSIRGEGRLRVAVPNSRSTVTVFIAAARPAFLHFEVIGFFGQPQAILASDGRTFALLQNDQGKYFQGPASPENVSRLLPVVLSGPELVSILLGAAPRIPAERLSAQALTEARAYLVTLWQGDRSQKLWIHPDNHRVLKSEMRGMAAYDLLFEDFQATGAIDLPRKITLFASAASATLELRYQELGVNPDLDPSLFKLAPPASAKVIELDENGRPRGSL